MSRRILTVSPVPDGEWSVYYVTLFFKLVARPAYLCWAHSEGDKWWLGLTSDPNRAARFLSHDEAINEAHRFLRAAETVLTVTHLEAVPC
jgi:hypothetical protein